MAGVIAPASAKPSVSARLRAFLRDQVAAQSLRWRLWAPVGFGAGCATYFGFKAEPPAWPLLLTAFAAAGLWLAGRRLGWARARTLPLMLLACFALGLSAAKLRSDAVAAPIAPAMADPTVIEAWVVDVDSPGSAGPRIILAPVRIDGLAPQ